MGDKISVANELEMLDNDSKTLLEFLNNLKGHGLLDSKNKSGLVVYADDQFVSR